MTFSKKLLTLFLYISAASLACLVIFYIGIALLIYLNLETISNKMTAVAFSNTTSNSAPTISLAQQPQNIGVKSQNTDIPVISSQKTVAQLVGFINQVDKITSIKSNLTLLPICEIICNSSRFNIDKSKNNAPDAQFFDFFLNNQNRAFDDFHFRIQLERLDDISSLFPDYIKKLLTELENLENVSEQQKIWFSLKAQYDIARFATHLNNLTINLEKKKRILDDLIKLRTNCGTAHIDETRSSCYKL